MNFRDTRSPNLEADARVRNANLEHDLGNHEKHRLGDSFQKLLPLLVWVLIGLVALLGWQNYNFRKRETASLHQQLHNANFLIVSAEVNLGLALTSDTPEVHLEKAAVFLARATPVLKGAAHLDGRYGDVWNLSEMSLSVAEQVIQEVWFNLLQDPNLETAHLTQIADTRAFLAKLSSALPKWNDTGLIQNMWQIEAARDAAEEYSGRYKTTIPGGT